MTNNELLYASLLDIIFDNRNKEYGAYALRKEYNQRLLISLGIGISLILFLVWINTVNKKEEHDTSNQSGKNEVIVSTVILPPYEKIEKPVLLPVKPAPGPVQPQTAEPVAAIEYPPIVIVADDESDTDLMPAQVEMTNKLIAMASAPGKDYTGEVVPVKTLMSSGSQDEVTTPSNKLALPNSSPEFPGGQEALMKFLLRNLDTPGELGNGEKMMVRASFKVDIDGLVSLVDIVQSGGNLFDREVIRVCKKMPRWKPAVQNGKAVAMSYILPVTFIGTDQ